MSKPDEAASDIERSCNPLWWSIVCCCPGLVGAALIWYVLPNFGAGLGPATVYLRWAATALLAVQVILAPFIGGFQFRIDPGGFTVTLGLLAIPIKRLPWSDVTSVSSVQGLKVLEAFRGFGWRINPASATTGYVLSNGPALCLATRNWTYLCSVDGAEALAAAAKRHLPT